jgi:S23 ribosomal protein.
MHDFHKLDVWHLSRRLGNDIFRSCARVTRPESRLITAQLRRSALGIAPSIAEGCGKRTRGEALRYLDIAAGSAAETEHHLIVAIETEILNSREGHDYLARIGSVRRMLFALIKNFPK